MFRANWQTYSPNNNVSSNSREWSRGKAHLFPKPKNHTVIGFTEIILFSERPLGSIPREQQLGMSHDPTPPRKQHITSSFTVLKWREQPWCGALKIITDITFIEIYQIYHWISLSPMRDMKKDCVSLEQARMDVRKLSIFFFVILFVSA